MYLIAVFLPFISFLFLVGGSNAFGRKGSSLLTIMSMFIVLLLSIIIFFETSLSGIICTITLFD
jgi:NADH:ubiquinone oxidoreductase subunit 5 (subunit L)/multisubunit Na+/H+ antiporter MnhA subunit